MIENPDKHIESFAKSGADIITIHPESTIHLDRSLSLIKSFGKKCGVSLVPSTHENVLNYVMDKIDLVLVMTVNPGFGGQKFLESQLAKITKIREKITESKKEIELEVDGGINYETAKQAVLAGADVLVSGSYIFSSESYKDAIRKIKP
jgi:ribulose-phosphate 3-epimerase